MVKREKITELIFGIHPIEELLKAKRRSIVTIYTTKPVPRAWENIERMLPKHTQIQYVTREILTRMAGTDDHQNVLAYATPFTYRSKPFDPKRHSFLVMLDGIQDPRNLGAIIRSAYCIGADGVILTKKKSSPMTAAAIKASAGLAEHMEIMLSPSPSVAVSDLKKAGFEFYLAALGGESALEVTYHTPLVLVIGNEATGISTEIKNAGTRVMLPQRREDISYNASVAAGILLFLVAEKTQKI